MKRLGLLLIMGLSVGVGWADELLLVGKGGVDLFDVPRHPLTQKDKGKLFDTGGARKGLVRGATIRVLERQQYEYGRSTYDGTVYTNMGAAHSYDHRKFFYRVGYVKVVDAPAQRHMEGRQGWIVLEKHYWLKDKWVAQHRAELSPSLGLPAHP